MSNSAIGLSSAWAIAGTKSEPTPCRFNLRIKIMEAMNLHVQNRRSWSGWPGGLCLAEAALDALGYPKDGT